MRLQSSQLSKNYYDILGVPNTADTAQIRQAYKKLARDWHPDKNRDPQAGVKFAEMTEAHECLIDAESREEYDCYSPYGRNYQAQPPMPMGTWPEEASSFDQTPYGYDNGHRSFHFGFFTQLLMQYLLIIAMEEILIRQPAMSPSSKPARPVPKEPEDSGLKLADGQSLTQIQKEVSHWLEATGRDAPAYTCQLKQQGTKAYLLVTAPSEQALHEVLNFMRREGLALTNDKPLTDTGKSMASPSASA